MAECEAIFSWVVQAPLRNIVLKVWLRVGMSHERLTELALCLGRKALDGEHQECGHKFPRVHPFLHWGLFWTIFPDIC